MPEQSTEENEKLIQEVYTAAMTRVHSDQSLEEPDRMVWEIEGMMQSPPTRIEGSRSGRRSTLAGIPAR